MTDYCPRFHVVKHTEGENEKLEVLDTFCVAKTPLVKSMKEGIQWCKTNNKLFPLRTRIEFPHC